ncbi:hypothetical protein V494_00483 [Pseudogymnoascus sp. VKM F-4513 (FW-928)]|nr:hypothetical protein V494_00483 [Pseudogymnoascus sp. VKM F-4513 (FW-928)]
MSNFKYFAYPGMGEWARETMGYSQAVRVGDRIEISGQGGWNPASIADGYSSDIKLQIDQAFKNVELCLKDAGGKGWTQVYRVNSYHTEFGPEVLAHMAENFRKWMPDHKPIWTAVGVAKLGGGEGMHVEIEVIAHDP